MCTLVLLQCNDYLVPWCSSSPCIDYLCVPWCSSSPCIDYLCVPWCSSSPCIDYLFVPWCSSSPCIVADDANIDVAGQRIMWGKCINAGQSCIAPDYILCTPATQERLVEACKTAVRKFFGEVHTVHHIPQVMQTHVAKIAIACTYHFPFVQQVVGEVN